MSTLAVNLWNLCLKHNYADLKFMASIKDYLTCHSARTGNVHLKVVLDQLSL